MFVHQRRWAWLFKRRCWDGWRDPESLSSEMCREFGYKNDSKPTEWLCMSRKSNLFPQSIHLMQPFIQCLIFPLSGSVAARLLGLRVRIPPKTCLSVCCEWCVLSGRGVWDCPITRPEESYQEWCFWVWSWIPGNEDALSHWGCQGIGSISNCVGPVLLDTLMIPVNRHKYLLTYLLHGAESFLRS